MTLELWDYLADWYEVTTPRGVARRGLLRKRFTYWWTLAPEGSAPALNKMFFAALTSRSATNPQEVQM